MCSAWSFSTAETKRGSLRAKGVVRLVAGLEVVIPLIRLFRHSGFDNQGCSVTDISHSVEQDQHPQQVTDVMIPQSTDTYAEHQLC